MIKRIINNLKKPHKIPYKLISKIKFIINKKKYNKEFYENQQNQIFDKLNLDRNLGLKKLNRIKEKHSFLNELEMRSEHQVLFSSLSCSTKLDINEILEIGTFDGSNAFLFSLLFENSNIETIDLESNQDDFKNFYERKNNISKFIEVRNQNLLRSNKINFREINSINLINYKKKYDLIWIDGAHGYPVVCMDILNSIKLIRAGGYIICDDIHVNSINSDKMYRSNAGNETLNELKKEGIINFNLIFKRLDAENNCLEENRKFIAIVSLTTS